MKIKLVDLLIQYQNLKQEIDTAIQTVVLETAFIGGYGNRFVKEFEDNFGAFLGARHCIGCANGTDSLEIALKSLGVGPLDEVIVPAMSWISTAESVSSVGARPVFVDIQEDTFTIDPGKIAEKITYRTKAIIPVHLYGQPADMEKIMEIANRFGLYVIEDCAQAHGAEYKAKKVGTIGHVGSFSFFPGKNLGAYGDAGGLITNDDKIAETARMIGNHGQKRKHEHEIEGRNSRLDGLQAAILNVKLKYLEEWTVRRKEIAVLYRELLGDSSLILPSEAEHTTHVFHLFVVRTRNRNSLQEKLAGHHIETSIHYPTPLPLLKAYRHLNCSEEDFPIASAVSKEVLSLPMYPELTVEQVRKICEVIQVNV